jgi:hypothetical protein
MDPKQMIKQMFDFNKTAVDKTFAAMAVMQDQTEKMFNLWLDQNKWFPEEGKKAMPTGSRPSRPAGTSSRPRWTKGTKKSKNTWRAGEIGRPGPLLTRTGWRLSFSLSGETAVSPRGTEWIDGSSSFGDNCFWIWPGRRGTWKT